MLKIIHCAAPPGQRSRSVKTIFVYYVKDAAPPGLPRLLSMHKAKLYANNNVIQRAATQQVLRQFVPRLRWACEAEAGERAAALDVGCGPGDVTAEVLLPLLPDSVRKTVGADVSEDMVRHAAATYANPRLCFVQNDITAPDLHGTPLGKEAAALDGFCKVFSFYVLNWVQDQSTSVSNIFELLRPGGEGLLIVAAHNPIFSAYQKLRQQPQWRQYMTDVDSFISPYHAAADPAGDFSILLKKAGFNVLECKMEMVLYHFPSTHSTADAVTAVNPFLKKIPEDKKSQFVMEVFQETQTQTERLMLQNGLKYNEDKQDVYYAHIVAHVEKCSTYSELRRDEWRRSRTFKEN